MRIPSANLFRMATKLIQTTPVQWFRFIGRSVNEIGQYESEYAPPVEVKASVQAAEATLIAALGLDIQPMYFRLYLAKDAAEVSRDGSGDKFLYNGKTLQALSSDYWFEQDGWVGILCVELKGA